MEFKKAICQCISQREILCLLLLLAVNGALSSKLDKDSPSPPPPSIIPNESDVTVMLYENVRLNCIANEPIYWRFHKAVYDFEITHNTHVSGDSNKYTYESVLDLNRVDSTYVDYYYCVKNTSEPNANIETLLRHQQAAQIYVFVEDRRRPLVPASVPILEGNQYDEIIIPCKPTSKNFEVQLFKEENVRREIHSPFSPNEGFRLKLNSTGDAGRYVCHAKFDVPEKFDIYFTVEVKEVSSNILSEPIISLKKQDFGIANDQLELECTVTVVSMTNRLEIKWELPNENIAKKENRIRIIPTAFQKSENSPAAFEAIGKLIVKNWDEEKDAGMYQCILNDVNHVKLATMNVKRISESRKPQLNLTDVFYKVGERVSVNCDISSFPPSKVLWSFIPCENVNFIFTCEESKRITFNEKVVRTFPQTPSTQRSTINLLPSGMGIIVCEATNDEGKTEARSNIIVNDISGEFAIWNANGMPIVAGDEVSIVCGASAFKYTEMNWYKDDALVTNTTNIQVVTKNTPYSQQKEIHWKSIGREAAGQYACRVKIIDSGSFVNKSWDLKVIEPTLPTIVSSNIVSDQSQKYLLNDHVKLFCKFAGIPSPTITWFKDNQEIIPIANSKHLTLLEDKSILSIHVNADDEGNYRCVAENRAGKVSREMKLTIESASGSAAHKFTPTAIAAIPLSAIIFTYFRFTM